jgi:hypothetical protein
LKEGFYAGLAPIRGSLKSLAEIALTGEEIHICTSPLSRLFVFKKNMIGLSEILEEIGQTK